MKWLKSVFSPTALSNQAALRRWLFAAGVCFDTLTSKAAASRSAVAPVLPVAAAVC